MNKSLQKYGAVFGLAASLILIADVVVGLFWVQSLSELTPEVIVQWANDHQFLIFMQPFLILAMIFLGVLLQAIEDRLKENAPSLASFSGRTGWFAIVLIALMITAQWSHLYANTVVWSTDIAHQFSRITYNIVVFFQFASSPFVAAWMIAAGIGGIVSRRFSKALSWITLIVGAVATLEFFGMLLSPLFVIPFVPFLGYITSFSFLIFIWFSAELLISSGVKLISTL